MKIISPPTKPGYAIVRFDCGTCGTVFEAEPDEVERTFSDDDFCYWKADCPTCRSACHESA